MSYLDDHSLNLGDLDQRTLDQWLATGRSTRHTVRDFIIWAARQRLASPLTVPHRQAIGPEQPLADDDRWQQLRRCIRDPEMPLRLRVAGSFVLLYGHPVSRVAAMRPHQVEEDANGVYLVIGSHRALLRRARRARCRATRQRATGIDLRIIRVDLRLALPRTRARRAPRRQLPGQTAQRRRHPEPEPPATAR